MYTKPEVVKLASAEEAIQSTGQKASNPLGDGGCSIFKTNPAYEADE